MSSNATNAKIQMIAVTVIAGDASFRKSLL
jgi:hypothetical protein